ncbi:hypothetical protein [Streptosporangium sandarakinum]|uniref:Uncharacterized protein n=1 Tax=Streptosporangium sandarakinum TaxID=1260955 RepID=A0A852V4N7_9ACTN|nr:hypothetical protein [Streptosporangium sandarakinum]NYF43046.1 hypothetical protein [Streptosporangium sandarakinum]
MKFVVQVQPFPTPAQEAAPADALRLCNEAAGIVSGVAWETQAFRNYDLRRPLAQPIAFRSDAAQRHRSPR